jgi:predicted MFS family arabinose efflux permease
VSALGSATAGTAISLLLLAQTRSPAVSSLASSLFMAGYLGSRLPAGWLGGRFGRRTVLQACNLAASLAAAALVACVAAHHLVLPAAYGAALAEGLASGVFGVIEATAIPWVVTPGALARAFALNQARTYTAQLAGPPLGGLLFGIGRILPFAANAASYLVSSVLLRRVRSPLQPAGGRPGPVSLVTGWRNFRATPFLLVSTLFVAASDFLLNAATWVVIVLAVSTGIGSARVGIVLASGAAGGLCGSLAAGRLRPRPSWIPALMPAMPVAGAALLTAISVAPGPLIGPPYAGMFVAWPLWQGLAGARTTELLPDAERAHTLAVTGLLSAAPSLLAAPAAGLLIATAGARPAAQLIAAAMAGLALTAALPRVRQAAGSLIAEEGFGLVFQGAVSGLPGDAERLGRAPGRLCVIAPCAGDGGQADQRFGLLVTVPGRPGQLEGTQVLFGRFGVLRPPVVDGSEHVEHAGLGAAFADMPGEGECLPGGVETLREVAHVPVKRGEVVQGFGLAVPFADLPLQREGLGQVAVRQVELPECVLGVAEVRQGLRLSAA